MLISMCFLFPSRLPELFASLLSCLVVVCSELDQPFLSFLLAQDTWSYLNAPEKYKSLQSVIIFHRKQEVTNSLSGVLNFKWHFADFIFIFKQNQRDEHTEHVSKF